MAVCCQRPRHQYRRLALLCSQVRWKELYARSSKHRGFSAVLLAACHCARVKDDGTRGGAGVGREAELSCRASRRRLCGRLARAMFLSILATAGLALFRRSRIFGPGVPR
eukprot:scaffold59450_cov57-Phaeocystis_antarctica.AAC.4